jgi:hypothetical protein
MRCPLKTDISLQRLAAGGLARSASKANPSGGAFERHGFRFSGHVQIKFAECHVRFTPEGGHVRCNRPCRLWDRSGYSLARPKAASAEASIENHPAQARRATDIERFDLAQCAVGAEVVEDARLSHGVLGGGVQWTGRSAL